MDVIYFTAEYCSLYFDYPLPTFHLDLCLFPFTILYYAFTNPPLTLHMDELADVSGEKRVLVTIMFYFAKCLVIIWYE